MDHPFISICIPAYKRPLLLKKLLDSIHFQRFRDFEVLINDNSPDRSVCELVATYKDHLPLNYVKNEPAVSATENCNRVMRRAAAPWIKVMHDDDWFANEGALEAFAFAAQHSGKDFIFCAGNLVDLYTGKSQKEELDPEKKRMLDDSVFSLCYLNLIGHPSAVMHKKDSTIEYDAAYNWVQDIDYYIRYIRAHNGYHYLPERLVNIGKSAGQESGRYYKNRAVEIPEYLSVLSKYDSGLLLRNQYVFHLVWNMLKRYRINDAGQVRSLGYSGKLPDNLDDMIWYQKTIPRIILKQTPWSKWWMKRCFAKLNQGLNK